VNGVSFDVMPGETLGLVGESGSGKTITVLSILRLLPRGARILSGEVLFDGENLLTKTEKEMEGVRGKRIGLILQSVEHMSHRIGVMYLGRLVELGQAEDVTTRPLHPYTATLVAVATPPERTPPWQLPIIGDDALAPLEAL
jgi:ABC-type dipeptide/oligopeptide/nickel transport system ATPase component